MPVVGRGKELCTVSALSVYLHLSKLILAWRGKVRNEYTDSLFVLDVGDALTRWTHARYIKVQFNFLFLD